MNLDIINRIKELMKTDATVTSEADFMATHMPFKKLANYRQDIYVKGTNALLKESDYEEVVRFDEQSVFDDLINDENAHDLFMIIGRNGSGKSHLIRWLYYQMNRYLVDTRNDSIKTIFIQRAHNSLKDAINTILDSGILSKDRLDYYNKKIGRGTVAASEGEIKETLFANLLIIIKYDEYHDGLSNAEYKKLIDFLSDSSVEKNYINKENGPIDNIYNFVYNNHNVEDVEYYFTSENFSLTQQERDKILNTSEHKASVGVRMFANDLATKGDLRNKITDYLNSLVGKVIERTSAITDTDVKSIFEEIRKELKNENKKLNIFIEDINAYKGIDGSLVECLIQEDTAENGLCRMKSVVGSTDYYFDKYFNDAVKDRMTRKIVILEKTLLEDNNKLIEYVARYVNAIHFSKKEIEDNYINNKETPVWKDNNNFSRIEIDGKTYSIFPFTQNAIINLFNCLDTNSRSPRGVIKSLIKPIELLWYEYGHNMINTKNNFRGIEGIDRLNGFINDTFKMAFEAKKYPDNERREILYTIWGDRTFTEDENGNMAGIPKEVYELFKIENVDKPDVIIDQPPKIQPIPPRQPEPIPPKPDIVQIRINDINDWADGTKVELSAHKEARNKISDFILSNINWDLEEIPYSLAESFFKKLQNYDIEGVNQEKKGPIKIERNKLTGQMLCALVKQDSYKESQNAWMFENGPEQEIIAKTWLQKNKDRILSSFREKVFQNNDIEQLVVDARLAEMLSQGIINGSDDSTIFDSMVRQTDLIIPNPHGDNSKWEELYQYYNSNNEDIKKFFDLLFLNTIGRTKADSGNVKYVFVDAVDLLRKIQKAKENVLKNKYKNNYKGTDERINKLILSIIKFQSLIDECIKETESITKDDIRLFKDWFGNVLSDEIIGTTFNSMIDYLNISKKETGSNYDPKLMTQIMNFNISEIKNLIDSLTDIIDCSNQLDLIIRCGSLKTNTINEILKCYNDFEDCMKAFNKIFSSKIDQGLNVKIDDTKDDIIRILQECIDSGKEI